jgi:hypothetical protein
MKKNFMDSSHDFFFFLEGRLSAAVPTCHQIFWPDTYLISSSRW